MKVIQIRGEEVLAKNMKNMVEKYPDLAMRELDDVTDYPYAEMLEEVPVRTGTLRRSLYKRGPLVKGGRIWVEFGSNLSYAIYVHECVNNRHDSPTKAKFIEDPITRWSPKIMDMLKERMARGLDDVVE